LNILNIEFPSETEKSTKSSTILYSNGERYDGQIKFNQPNGFGTIYKLQINKLYEGEFFNGLKHGKGYLSMDNGSFYDGNFQNDLFHGRGLFYTKDFKYEGEFKFGEFDGLGIKTDFNKAQAYEGEWEKGKRNGDINFYHMKLESASIWKDDKKNEVTEIILNTEAVGASIYLNYNNINKTSKEFKEMFRRLSSGNFTEFKSGFTHKINEINELNSSTITLNKNKGNIVKMINQKEISNTNASVKEDLMIVEKLRDEKNRKSIDSSNKQVTLDDKDKIFSSNQEALPSQDANCIIY